VGVISEIKKLEVSDVFLVLAAFLGLIGPGFLVLFQFQSQLVIQLDFAKLTLFAVALSLPPCLLHGLMLLLWVAIANPRPPNSTVEDEPELIRDPRLWLTAALGMNALVVDVNVLEAYWERSSFREFLKTFALSELYVFVLGLLLSLVMLREKKKAAAAQANASDAAAGAGPSGAAPPASRI
jgi:hypothetical protein